MTSFDGLSGLFAGVSQAIIPKVLELLVNTDFPSWRFPLTTYSHNWEK